MKSKDTQFAAIKLPKCPTGGMAAAYGMRTYLYAYFKLIYDV